MREKLLSLIEEMAAAEDFDETKFNEFFALLNTLKSGRGLLGAAADEMTEYYAWWRQNKRQIPPTAQEAREIREHLRLLAEALRRNWPGTTDCSRNPSRRPSCLSDLTYFGFYACRAFDPFCVSLRPSGAFSSALFQLLLDFEVSTYLLVDTTLSAHEAHHP